MNTGISKNRGIGSLQYRCAKKNRYSPPLFSMQLLCFSNMMFELTEYFNLVGFTLVVFIALTG